MQIKKHRKRVGDEFQTGRHALAPPIDRHKDKVKEKFVDEREQEEPIRSTLVHSNVGTCDEPDLSISIGRVVCEHAYRHGLHMAAFTA